VIIVLDYVEIEDGVGLQCDKDEICVCVRVRACVRVRFYLYYVCRGLLHLISVAV
jgi:hypothetical protein